MVVFHCLIFRCRPFSLADPLRWREEKLEITIYCCEMVSIRSVNEAISAWKNRSSSSSADIKCQREMRSDCLQTGLPPKKCMCVVSGIFFLPWFVFPSPNLAAQICCV